MSDDDEIDDELKDKIKDVIDYDDDLDESSQGLQNLNYIKRKLFDPELEFI